jgi:ABC-type nitrate/sulfonate/bicarbonate transport system ATPase subunit
MITVDGVTFKYNTELILDKVAFEIMTGDSLAIAGASGCGKSTLLRIIAGLLPNNKKHVFSGEVLVYNLMPKQYVKGGKLSFMFQEDSLMPNLNVMENVEFPLKIRRIKDAKRIDKLLDIVGLSEYANYFPKDLSGGMKTRVALARSFVTNPQVLLLDEPFASLDIAWKSKLYKELISLKSMHETTVLIVTHDVQEALLLSNSILVLNNRGSSEYSERISTTYGLNERVNNISSYMLEVYDKYFIPIQKSIIDGKNR